MQLITFYKTGIVVLFLILSMGKIYGQLDSPFNQVFPEANIINTNSNSEGYVIGCRLIKDNIRFLNIFDDYGTLLFCEKIFVLETNFEYHSTTNQFTYFDGAVDGFIVLNDKYERIDTIKSINADTDSHELLILENGDRMVLGSYILREDLSPYMTNADTNRAVLHFTIQRISSDGELLAEWKTEDNIGFDTATSEYSNSSGGIINFIHINSIEAVTDSLFVISSRNINEITKINIYTNEVVWRMGGLKNEFTFINDSIGFAGQHDARIISNGHLTLFDNGISHEVLQSSMLEYEVDEALKTVRLVDRITGPNPMFTPKSGNARRLYNGNNFINWTSNPTIIETDSLQNVIWACNLGSASYRANKAIFKPNFMASKDSLLFAPDSSLTQFTVHNNSVDSLVINGYHLRDSVFTINTMLPVSIQKGDSAKFDIEYIKDDFNDDFIDIKRDVLTLFFDTENRRIGHQINLHLTKDSLNQEPVDTVINALPFIAYNQVQLSPNPSNDFFILSNNWEEAEQVNIYNVNGKLISEHFLSKNQNKICTLHLLPGLYFCKIPNLGISKRFAVVR